MNPQIPSNRSPDRQHLLPTAPWRGDDFPKTCTLTIINARGDKEAFSVPTLMKSLDRTIEQQKQDLQNHFVSVLGCFLSQTQEGRTYVLHGGTAMGIYLAEKLSVSMENHKTYSTGQVDSRFSFPSGQDPNKKILIEKTRKLFPLNQELYNDFDLSVNCDKPSINGLFNCLKESLNNYLTEDAVEFKMTEPTELHEVYRGQGVNLCDKQKGVYLTTGRSRSIIIRFYGEDLFKIDINYEPEVLPNLSFECSRPYQNRFQTKAVALGKVVLDINVCTVDQLISNLQRAYLDTFSATTNAKHGNKYYQRLRIIEELIGSGYLEYKDKELFTGCLQKYNSICPMPHSQSRGTQDKALSWIVCPKTARSSQTCPETQEQSTEIKPQTEEKFTNTFAVRLKNKLSGADRAFTDGKGTQVKATQVKIKRRNQYIQTKDYSNHQSQQTDILSPPLLIAASEAQPAKAETDKAEASLGAVNSTAGVSAKNSGGKPINEKPSQSAEGNFLQSANTAFLLQINKPENNIESDKVNNNRHFINAVIGLSDIYKKAILFEKETIQASRLETIIVAAENTKQIINNIICFMDNEFSSAGKSLTTEDLTVLDILPVALNLILMVFRLEIAIVQLDETKQSLSEDAFITIRRYLKCINYVCALIAINENRIKLKKSDDRYSNDLASALTINFDALAEIFQNKSILLEALPMKFYGIPSRIIQIYKLISNTCLPEMLLTHMKTCFMVDLYCKKNIEDNFFDSCEMLIDSLKILKPSHLVVNQLGSLYLWLYSIEKYRFSAIILTTFLKIIREANNPEYLQIAIEFDFVSEGNRKMILDLYHKLLAVPDTHYVDHKTQKISLINTEIQKSLLLEMKKFNSYFIDSKGIGFSWLLIDDAKIDHRLKCWREVDIKPAEEYSMPWSRCSIL